MKTTYVTTVGTLNKQGVLRDILEDVEISLVAVVPLGPLTQIFVETKHQLNPPVWQEIK
jgi:hypothetical protein